MLKKLFILLSSTMLIFACSSTKGPGSNDTNSAGMEFMQNGFLLSLVGKEGWSVVDKESHKVTLVKQGATGGYTIQALVVSLSSFESDKRFLKFVKNKMAKSRKKLKVMSHKTSMVSVNREQCVQYKSTEKRKSQSGQAVTLEVVSFTCRHPYNLNAGVYMALSKTYSPGSSRENLSESAMDIFSNLQYTEL